jgi:RNA 2',3'-cyclic 3'-phosphodiesterase
VALKFSTADFLFTAYCPLPTKKERLVRAFIAIPLPKDCQTMLESMQRDLRESGADVRWVPITSIHLTLKFLGEVEPEIIPKMAQSLRTISQPEQPLNLRIGGLGSFPASRNPKVVWCGIGGDTENLLRLQQKIETVCADMGFPPEERSFQPHLTLGRVKGKRNLQRLQDCIKIGSDLEYRFKADQYHVYRSTLKPQGAVYTILGNITLGLP